MRRVLSSSQMSQMDLTTSSFFHVPSLVLMERAALAVAEECEKHLPKGGRVAVISGCGNNGGDAMACARILYTRHIPVEVLLFGNREKLSSSAATQLDILEQYRVPVFEKLNELKKADLYVDGLFGNGLSREVAGEYADLIRQMNEIAGYKIAIDIPSGISADTGAVMGVALKCDETVTFNFEKIGHLMYPGREYSGSIVVADVGITEHSMQNTLFGMLALSDEDIHHLLPDRYSYSNKGTYGKALIIAGSGQIAGAALMAASACLHMGCGMVRVVTHENNRTALVQYLPEALITTYEDAVDEEALSSAIEWADAVLVGPGLGTDEVSEHLLTFTLEHCEKAMILDADALNLIAAGRVHLPAEHGLITVTPHLGEMSRLTGEPVREIQKKLISAAEDYASFHNVTCVLKDAATITAVPGTGTFINTSGNSGMATAGSGDVLAGMMTGLMTQDPESPYMAPLAVYLHGRCGDLVRSRMGEYAMTASDLIAAIPEALSLGVKVDESRLFT